MTNYIKIVEEFDARQYLPSETGFDIQGYIDWIMSFENKGGTWPCAAVLNPDNSLTVTWFDPAYSAPSHDDVISEGMYGLVRVVPASNHEVIWFASEEFFTANYQPKV